MKKIIILFFVIISLFIIYLEYETRIIFFNKNKTKCITIWKTLGGKCYITPFVYKSIFRPQNECIITDNNNKFLVVWDNNKSYDFVIINSGDAEMNCKFKKYKLKYFDLSNSNDTLSLNNNYFKKYKNISLIDTMDSKLIDLHELR